MFDVSVLDDSGVSERESEVLALLGEHLTHAEIGARLFISVRTVESHVASLRRKLDVPDRRELVQLAVRYRAAQIEAATARRVRRRPVPLTSFVGRAVERAALAETLGASRLVTAVGPGGVGKTRLALAVTDDLAGRFAGGACYVDLVPVIDPLMVSRAVATAMGLAEPANRSAEDILVAAIADRPVLLVLDNCEHLVNSVAVLVERLLSDCPELVVLVTSRIRLVVPFERVYPVPGLSLAEADDGDDDSHDGLSSAGDSAGDAVALFVERAGTAGAPPLTDDDRRRITSICRALDGMALAIELAAARLPALGLDGLEAGMADQVGTLAGGPRLQARHRSLQETLDWSYRLLDPVDQAVLRRVSVFAAPFTATAAADVAGYPPVEPEQVAAALGRLVDHSLLVAVPGLAGGSGYRALETIRQHGAGEMRRAADHEAPNRHVLWCLATAADLDDEAPGDGTGWRAAFDAVAADLRAALGWAEQQPDHHPATDRLATTLAHLLFVRGRTSEAQHRYEQAARLTDDQAEVAAALRQAAAVAKCRVAGNEAFALDRAAADAALRAGDPVTAAITLARVAELASRFQGMFAEPPPPVEVADLLVAARVHAAGNRHAEAAIAVAEANSGDSRDRARAELAGPAVDLARRTGDRVLESAALDAAALACNMRGDRAGAAAMLSRRVELLAPLAAKPAAAFELKDALHAAVLTSISAGDLRAARHYAEQQRALPFLSEEPDLASEELLAPAALAGDWDTVLATAEVFERGWVQAGRPAAPGRGISPAAVAMVHGLRGEAAARVRWLGILAAIRGVDDASAGRGSGYGEAFDAIVLLHNGKAGEALALLATEPETMASWYGELFRQWYLALRAEAAVLSGNTDRDAADHVALAQRASTGNPMAAALADRAGALLAGDRTALLAAAERLRDAGSRYQWARSLVLVGDPHRAEGEAALAALGATETIV